MAKKTDLPSEPSLPNALQHMPRTARGFGWKKDVDDPRDAQFSARKLFGAIRAAAPEATLEEYLLNVLDQGGTSTCVGHGVGTALITRLRKMGQEHEDVSRLAIWDFAVAAEKGKDQPFVDQGCFIRDAMRGCRDQGIPPLSAWPPVIAGGYTKSLEASVTSAPPWDVLQKAATFRVQNWYRIDDVGYSRVDAICQAIAHGYPVVFGTEVDQAFEDYSGKDVVKAPGSFTLGGHCMCAIGYRTVNGKRQIRGVNSWGYGWGDRGLFWADASFFMDARMSDVYVMSVG